jgi:tetratricopeptide (TPR) repeat protein
MKNRIPKRLLGAMALWLLPLGLFAYSSADYFKGGLSYYQAQNYSMAERYFAYAAQLDPQNYQAAAMLGYCEGGLGQSQQAILDLQKSLAIHPDNPAVEQYLKTLQAALGVSTVPAASSAVTVSAKPTSAPTVISKVMVSKTVTVSKVTASIISAPVTQATSAPSKTADLNPNYVWDPAVDPYPKYTGPADPLPKPEIPIVPLVDATVAYEIGAITFASVEEQYGNPLFYPGILSLEINYQLDPFLSINLGTEIWPNLKSTYYYFGNNTDSFKITPVSLGLLMHLWGKGISLDAGAGLAAFIFQHQYDYSYTYSEYPKTFTNTTQGTTNGVEFGCILQMDLNIALIPQNQLTLGLTGKGYIDTGLGLGTYSETQSQIISNPPSAPTTSTYNYGSNYTGSEDGLGIVGASIGANLTAGF